MPAATKEWNDAQVIDRDIDGLHDALAAAKLRYRPDQGVDAARRLLLDEISSRGLLEPEPKHMATLLDVITRSAWSAWWRGAARLVKMIFGIAREFHWNRLPGWTRPPADTPHLLSWRDDQKTIRVPFDISSATDNGHATLVRLFADLPFRTVTTDDPGGESKDDVRYFHYAITWNPATGAEGAVTVFVGRFPIGRLQPPHDELARRLIAEHGLDRHAVELYGEIHGPTLSTGHITLYMPDRP